MKLLQWTALIALMGACSDSGKDSSDPAIEAPKTALESDATVGAEPAPASEPAPAPEPVPASEQVQLFTAEVNATSIDTWNGLDLETSSRIPSENLASDQSWDLAFKKTAIKVQAPGVSVHTITDKTFEEVTEVPADAAFQTDAPVPGSKETDGLVFHAGKSWYTYDMEKHVVNSNHFVYLVKTAEGHIYKLALPDYYNADRLPAYVQVKWQLLQSGE